MTFLQGKYAYPTEAAMLMLGSSGRGYQEMRVLLDGYQDPGIESTYIPDAEEPTRENIVRRWIRYQRGKVAEDSFHSLVR